MNHPDGVAILLGILFGMFYVRQTGESPGGIITPGLVAMRLSDPAAIGGSLGVALALGVALRLLFRVIPVYGRQRVALAMACALVIRLLLPGEWFREGTPWLGWVAPGLIAADVERQGIPATLSGLASVSIAVSWGTSLVATVTSLWR